MIKLFYDTTTGEITSTIELSEDFEHDLPHIDVPALINMNEWKVNLDTHKLEPKVDVSPQISPPKAFAQLTPEQIAKLLRK